MCICFPANVGGIDTQSDMREPPDISVSESTWTGDHVCAFYTIPIMQINVRNRAAGKEMKHGEGREAERAGGKKHENPRETPGGGGAHALILLTMVPVAQVCACIRT